MAMDAADTESPCARAPKILHQRPGFNVQIPNLTMPYKDLVPPAGGKISTKGGKLNVPDNPVLPFIRGDGTGPDIWAASQRVFDAAVDKAYGGKGKISWLGV